MGRRTEGWRLRGGVDDTKTVRFSHARKRHEYSTGERDPVRARAAAAKIYADVVTGRRSPAVAVAERPAAPIFAEWLGAMKSLIAPSTHGLWTIYVSAHYLDTFATTRDFSTARAADYMRRRIGQVSRETVKKELSPLRSFFTWALEQGLVGAPVVVPPVPRSALGVRATTRHAGRADVSPDDAAAVLAALPEWSSSAPDRFRVRAYFQVLWETSLRPATVQALRVPEHYRPGHVELVVEDRIDKARFGRTVPLTERACAVLNAVAPEAGPIFGRHDYRGFLRRAAALAGRPELAERMTPYDIRHGRLTELAEQSLPGAAFLAGHRRMTTTTIYAKPTARAARAMLERLGGDSGGDSPGPGENVVRRAGLEPARCYPLAPQASARPGFPLNLSAGTPQESAENGTSRRAIGDAPPEFLGDDSAAPLRPLAHALRLLSADAEAFDRWLLADEEGAA